MLDFARIGAISGLKGTSLLRVYDEEGVIEARLPGGAAEAARALRNRAAAD